MTEESKPHDYRGVFVGTIKNNADAQRMGRLQVYISDFSGSPTDPNNWYTVSYSSPFAGATSLSKNVANSKDMAGTQQSYGFWAIPPDLENQVLVCFAGGDPARGYFIGCLYQQFMNHMVPGLALNISTNDSVNQANLPPVCEYNKKDTSQNVWDPRRAIFSPLYDGLVAEGLFQDSERGPVTSSARREAPSKVFGLSSPRGNHICIDDDPTNEFIRLRTRSGAQILIHETTGYIYMISKQGNSWVEISDIGIDMYSKRSISLRAEENINLHADQNIIMHGAGAVHTTGSNVTRRSMGRITEKADGEIHRHSPRIKDNSQATPGASTNNQTPGSPGIDSTATTPPTDQPYVADNPNPPPAGNDGDAATSPTSEAPTSDAPVTNNDGQGAFGVGGPNNDTTGNEDGLIRNNVPGDTMSPQQTSPFGLSGGENNVSAFEGYQGTLPSSVAEAPPSDAGVSNNTTPSVDNSGAAQVPGLNPASNPLPGTGFNSGTSLSVLKEK